MDIFTELNVRVERLVEWNRFDRVMRFTLESSMHFKRELERLSPNGQPIDKTDWPLLRMIWGRWLDSDLGKDELTLFVGGLKWVNQPLNGRSVTDFAAAVERLVKTSDEIVAALTQGNLGGLHTHARSFDQQLRELNRLRRDGQENELSELLQAVAALQKPVAA